MIVLTEAGNIPAARMVARPLFELGAHAYYVTKHLKQHIEADAMLAAWDFLTPIATGSRYINARIPEESELFPLPAHISKVINCFREKIPEAAREDYSYLSEFCHPNVLAFFQYYEYSDPETVRFIEPKTQQGFSGATTAAIIQGLLSLTELLELTREHQIRRSVVGLLKELAALAKGQEPPT
jgi:hypothetical protein